MRIPRTKSRCAGCPLDGQNKVWGCSERADAPQIVIIGEAPGEREDVEGKPFVGPAGRFLKSALSRASLRADSLYFTNVISCRPPKNVITSPEAAEAIERCSEGLKEELSKLRERGAKVFLALGNTARDALLPRMRRGYVYETDYGPTLMTWHPSFILRGMIKEEPTWVNDLAKARDIATGDLSLVKPSLLTHPTIEWLETTAKRLIERDAILGVDIETSGFRPKEAKIIVVGIAPSSEEAFSIPFMKQYGSPYWPDLPTELRAWNVVRSLMAKCRTLFQNAPFDMGHLRDAGAPVLRLFGDVLLAHHALSPELPHNLEYIASCFGSTENWKDEVKNDPRKMLDMEDTKLRTYNLIDSVVLHQCHPRILKELEEDGTRDVYEERSLPRVELVLELTDAGVRVDQERLREWREDLERRQVVLEGEMRSSAEVTPSFSFTSPRDMRYLLYGDIPTGLSVKRIEYEKILADPKRRKDTKKFLDLKRDMDIYGGPRFEPPKCAIPRTETNLKSIDGLARQALAVGISSELQYIDGLKRPTDVHEARREHLTRLARFLKIYDDWAEVTKLLTTYSSVPTAPDGRVHPTYSIHGTATSRLSSSNPNWQNVPSHSALGKGLRRSCVPESGNVFLKADYKQMEIIVLAYATGDEELLRYVRDDISIHSEHAKLLIPGIEPGHEKWKTVRDATKTYNFGRFAYAGTQRGIFEKILIQVPDLGLTWNFFRSFDDSVMSLHPGYLGWKEGTIKRIRETRCVENAFGRKRYLLGQQNAIEREGLNYPIQSTAGEIALGRQLALLHEFRKRFNGSRPRLIVSEHDGVVVELRKDLLEESARIMKDVLEAPVELTKWGVTVKFPVEVEWSPTSWGEMQEFAFERAAE